LDRHLEGRSCIIFSSSLVFPWNW